MTDIQIKYYFSKRILLGLFFGVAMPLLVVAFLIIVNAPLLYKAILYPLSFLLLIITVPGNLRNVYCLFSKTPAIILSKEYLTDNINKQNYEWSDIYNIFLKPDGRNIRINIGEVNKSKYIAQTKPYLNRLILKINLAIAGGVFWINSSSIKCDKTELVENLIKFTIEAEKKQTKSRDNF